MRIRTYEEKNSSGVVVTSGVKCWWNHTINMSQLAPNRATGISGMVSARGGWCKQGDWQNPENPVTLQSTAVRWASLLGAELGVSAGAVIEAIANTLETLEDERLNPPVPLAPQPVVEPVVPPEEPAIPEEGQ